MLIAHTPHPTLHTLYEHRHQFTLCQCLWHSLETRLLPRASKDKKKKNNRKLLAVSGALHLHAINLCDHVSRATIQYVCTVSTTKIAVSINFPFVGCKLNRILKLQSKDFVSTDYSIRLRSTPYL